MTGYILGDVLVGDFCHRVLTQPGQGLLAAPPGARTPVSMNSVKTGALWQVSRLVKQGE